MPRLNDARTRILDSAQAMVQHRGYGGFSYRDIAGEIGVKSASIHYHFPSKDDLVVELARRYRDGFFKRLAQVSAADADPVDRITAFAGLFREALVEEDRMCLCGMLAADAELLTQRARGEAEAFFVDCTAWLEGEWRRLGVADGRRMALAALARLEGGMLISRISGTAEAFEAAAEGLIEEAVKLRATASGRD